MYGKLKKIHLINITLYHCIPMVREIGEEDRWGRGEREDRGGEEGRRKQHWSVQTVVCVFEVLLNKGEDTDRVIWASEYVCVCVCVSELSS